MNIPKQEQSISFALEGIEDGFTVPKADVYTSDLIVSAWHSTLHTGFERGFSPNFAALEQPADLTLRITKTQLYFRDHTISATAISTAGSATATAIAITCHLQYQAALVNAQGEVVGQEVGEVEYSNGQWGRQELVQGAVERMFEALATKMFVEKSPTVVASGGEAPTPSPVVATGETPPATSP